MAMRALGAASPSRLMQYESRIAKLNVDFGPQCWWLLAQADQRMRGEHWERLRRRAEAEAAGVVAMGGNHPFDAARPWDYVLNLAAADHIYWQEEVVQKALLYATHLQTKAQITDPGHGVAALRTVDAGGGRGQRSGGGGGAKRPGESASGKRQRQRGDAKAASSGAAKGGGGGKGQSKGKASRRGTTESGQQICFAWARDGGCTEPCPAKRAHVCEICLGSHRTIDHKA